MKRWYLTPAIWLLAAIVLAPSLPARGEDNPGKEAKSLRAGRAHRGEWDKLRARRLRELIQSMDLSDEQEAQVRQILQTQRQAVMNWRRENAGKFAELREKLQEARKAQDKAAVEAAIKEMKELGEARKQLHEDLIDQLKKVLDKEQMAKIKRFFADIRRRGRRGAMLLGAIKRLDLSEEQKAAARKILQAAKAQANKAEKPEEKAEIMFAAFAKIRKEVLTDEQRKKLEEMRERWGRGRRGAFGRLDLTDEQKEQIEAIREQAREKAKAAETRQARREIRREAIKKIIEEVLTDEQRRKLHQGRGQRLRHRRRGGEDHPEGRGD